MSFTLVDLETNGVCGFPQDQASVLCDNDSLRLSVWNNCEYLFVQAILWKVSEHTLGKTEDNRDIGNYSNLGIAVAATEGKRSFGIDRRYSLNPWPHLPGLYYQVLLSENATTGLEKDSKGRGCIRYLETRDRQPVRVDSYLIPLSEIARSLGDRVGLCYWGFSPNPVQTVNSVGYEPADEAYSSHSIPLTSYHDYQLISGHEIDPHDIPDDRSEAPPPSERNMQKPQIGAMAPEIIAEDWLNTDGCLNWESLRGQVVLLDFWATWCVPCLAGITHLNQMHEGYRKDGFQVVSLVCERKPFMEKVVEEHSVRYPVGTNTSSGDAYGIDEIPYAFLVDRTGRIRWHGWPDPQIVEEEVAKAVAT